MKASWREQESKAGRRKWGQQGLVHQNIESSPARNNSTTAWVARSSIFSLLEAERKVLVMTEARRKYVLKCSLPWDLLSLGSYFRAKVTWTRMPRNLFQEWSTELTESFEENLYVPTSGDSAAQKRRSWRGGRGGQGVHSGERGQWFNSTLWLE